MGFSGDSPRTAPSGWREGLRRRTALGLGSAALLGLLFATTSLSPTRATLALRLGLLALAGAAAALAAGSRGDLGGARRGLFERAAGPALLLGAMLILGLTILRDPHTGAVPVTLLLLVLFCGLIAAILRIGLGSRVAPVGPVAALAFLLAIAAPQQALAAAALADALRGVAVWGTLGVIAAGVGALILLDRRSQSRGADLTAVLMYAVTVFGLVAWWHWGGPLDQLGPLPHIAERRALSLLPVVVAIGGAAQIIVALIVRPARWGTMARADLCAHLILVVLPVAATVMDARGTIRSQRPDVSWLAGFLVALVALRTLTAVATLLRAADDEHAGGRRLAAALLAVSLGVYWPATLWHNAVAGVTGDEPQYLAATMSLWYDQNFQIANSLFSPEMNALLHDAPGERTIHIYEDDTRDRLIAGVPAVSTTALYLPLAGGGSLEATVLIANPGLEPAGVRVTFRDTDGVDVATQETIVAPEGMTLLRAPAGHEGLLSAALEAGKPIVATIHLSDPRAGEETYAAGSAVPRRCTPFDLGDRAWDARILVQNPLAEPISAAWQQLDDAGAIVARGEQAIPSRGLAIVSVQPDSRPGTLCVTGETPIAVVLLARGTPGLLVLPGTGPSNARMPLPTPQALAYTNLAGWSAVLAYNPHSTPVEIAIFDDQRTEPVAREMLPPRTTRRFAIERAAEPLAGRAQVLVPSDTLVTSIITGVGTQVAGFPGTAAPTVASLMPIPGGAGRIRRAGQLELVNGGERPVMAILTLSTLTGERVWGDKVWVCAGCVVTYRFWHAPLDGLLTVQADVPLGATLLEREVVSARPFHSVGISVLLLPGYALAGWRGAYATTGFAAAALVVAIYALLLGIGITRRIALGTAALVGYSSPIVTQAVHLYGDITGVLLPTTALALLGGRGPLRPGRIVGAAACAAATPLIHPRLLPLALVLLGALAARLGAQAFARARRSGISRRQILWLVAAFGAVTLAIAAVVAREPRLQPVYLLDYLAFATAGRYLLGILFDRGTGLLPSMPILLLVGTGFIAAIRRAPFLGWSALALCGAQIAAVALRSGGWQLYGYPGRYILPALPFLAVALGAAWERGFTRPVRFLARLLAAWGLLVAACYLWFPLVGDYIPHPYRWAADALLQSILGANPLGIFPVIPQPIALEPRVAATLTAILVGGLIIGWYPDRCRRGRSAALPLPSLGADMLQLDEDGATVADGAVAAARAGREESGERRC